MHPLEKFDAPDTIAEADWFLWLWNHLAAQGRLQEDDSAALFVELALALAQRGQIDLAVSSIIELSDRLGMDLASFYKLCLTLVRDNPAFSETSLLAHYIRNGGDECWAYEVEIIRQHKLEQHERALSLFERSRKWFPFERYSDDILFTVSCSFLACENLGEAFSLLAYLVKRTPRDARFMKNITYLAVDLKYGPAKELYRSNN